MSFKLKSIAAATMLLSSTLVFAGGNYKDGNFKDAVPCPTPPALMDGFYVGLQGGYDSYDVGTNFTGTSDALIASGSNDLSATGWVGGLFLGYGRYFSNYYYLAGEIFGNYSNADGSLNLTNTGSSAVYNGKFTVNGSYGLAVLPGLKLTDSSLLYIRLGYNWASLKYREFTTGASAASKSNTEGGFAYGIGLESLITGPWSVRGEFTHTNYGSFKTSMGTGFSTSVNPSDNQFMVGLNYHI